MDTELQCGKQRSSLNSNKDAEFILETNQRDKKKKARGTNINSSLNDVISQVFEYANAFKKLRYFKY